MFGRDEKVSQLRLTAVQYVLLGVFLVLAFGLWRLQVARSDYYSTLAEQNRIKQVPILAPRGKILDREGRIIVDNYPSFSVFYGNTELNTVDFSAGESGSWTSPITGTIQVLAIAGGGPGAVVPT